MTKHEGMTEARMPTFCSLLGIGCLKSEVRIRGGEIGSHLNSGKDLIRSLPALHPRPSGSVIYVAASQFAPFASVFNIYSENSCTIASVPLIAADN